NPRRRTQLRPTRRRPPYRAGIKAPGAGAGVPALCRTRPKRAEAMTMLIDSHCHLDFPDFAGDLDAIVERARAAGLARIVTISTRVGKQPELLAITERFQDVFCSVGTHPQHAHEELDLSAADLVARTKNPK